MLREDKITVGLAELELLDRAALALRWEGLMNRSPPKAASRVFLLRALAYELQSQYSPGLSKTDDKTLRASLGGDSNREAKSKTEATRRPAARLALVPGARLVREWNGQPYTVSVIKEGFVYKDRVWTSLSAIAKDITGAHWSGPRFFGLDRAA